MPHDDSARLDWLERAILVVGDAHGVSIYHLLRTTGYGDYQIRTGPGRWHKGETLRQAIDVAMEAEARRAAKEAHHA